MKLRLLPLALVLGALSLAAVLSACGSSDDDTATAGAGAAATGTGAAPDAPAKQATLALDWFAQPSSGGAYAAQAQGLYERAGLDVKIQPGSAHATSVQIVGAGRAQFGLETAENILQARAQGIPVVALAATLQRSPAALFFHSGQQIDSYRDLNGRVVYTQIGAPQWLYQKRKYGLDSVKDRQFAGSYAAFAQDETAVAQGYLTSTPAQLKAQGLDVESLPNPDAKGYGSVLFTTEKTIAEDPQLVRAFVGATAAGWDYYESHVPEVSETLAKVAKGRTVADLTAEGEAQKPFVFSGDAETHGFGWMTAERWQTVADQLLEWDAIRQKVDAQDAFTTEFLPGR